MTETDIDECLRLLHAADEVLMAHEQYLVAAHLSMAIELLAAQRPIEQ